MRTARALRWLAIAIATAAVIDPAITSRRRVDSVVAVIAADPSNAARAEQVGRELARTFTVVRAPFAAAAATVLVGAHLPPGARSSGGAAFAVLPNASESGVTLDDVHAPSHAPLHSRVTVVASLASFAAATVDVTLLQGDVPLDRVAVQLPPRDTLARVALSFVPTHIGAALLRVSVSVNGEHTTFADVVVDVRNTRWSVLFYEPRPSWMSTFVRRALEQDPRFVVSSRTLTSRNIATEYGRPPRRFEELANTEYDVVIVGAPEALSDGEVVALERYLRRRGGGVALLLDRPATGAYQRLAGSGPWQHVRGTAALLRGADSAAFLRAAAHSRPAQMPVLAVSIAERGEEPAVWRVPVGAGRVLVSGALDSWRFRDPEVSGFDAFWRGALAELAMASPPALDAALERPVVRPGDWTELNVTVRDALLAADASGASVGARVRETGSVIRLAPGDRMGEVSGRLRAPLTPGTYVVAVTSGVEEVAVPLVVRTDAIEPARAQPELLRAWTESRGGATIDATSSSDVADMILAAIPTERRAEPWHPLRSPWWIVPFVLALSAEWWTRRRRGLP